MAQALVEHHGGEVPADMDALVKLPGVGRKTANVVLGHALGVPGLPVDRHVLRVANRLGLVHSDDPEKVEADSARSAARSAGPRRRISLILHGRRICRPKPLCQRCNARKDCDFFIGGSALADRRQGARDDRKARPRRPERSPPTAAASRPARNAK